MAKSEQGAYFLAGFLAAGFFALALATAFFAGAVFLAAAGFFATTFFSALDGALAALFFATGFFEVVLEAGFLVALAAAHMVAQAGDEAQGHLVGIFRRIDVEVGEVGQPGPLTP